jgi:hypothetical protein
MPEVELFLAMVRMRLHVGVGEAIRLVALTSDARLGLVDVAGENAGWFPVPRPIALVLLARRGREK